MADSRADKVVPSASMTTNPYSALEHAPSPAPPAPQHEMDEMELALALSLAEAGGAAPPDDADTELARALQAVRDLLDHARARARARVRRVPVAQPREHPQPRGPRPAAA